MATLVLDERRDGDRDRDRLHLGTWQGMCMAWPVAVGTCMQARPPASTTSTSRRTRIGRGGAAASGTMWKPQGRWPAPRKPGHQPWLPRLQEPGLPSAAAGAPEPAPNVPHKLPRGSEAAGAFGFTPYLTSPCLPASTIRVRNFRSWPGPTIFPKLEAGPPPGPEPSTEPGRGFRPTRPRALLWFSPSSPPAADSPRQAARC